MPEQDIPPLWGCRYEDGDSEELAWEEVFGKKAKDVIKDIRLPAAAARAYQKQQTVKKRKAGDASSERPGPASTFCHPGLAHAGSQQLTSPSSTRMNTN